MRKFLQKLYLGLICLFLYAPIFTLIVMSFNDTKTLGRWKGFTLNWYREVLSNDSIREALINTLVIALVSAVVATIVGVAACMGIMAMKARTQRIVMQLTNIPLLNAEIVTALALMLAFAMFGISLGMGTILFSHITFCLPYVILNVMPKLRQTGKVAYEAALDLGATPVYAFFKVIVPDIKPGIMSGFLMAFTMSVDDFIITYFTRGAGINTLSTLIYSQVRVGIRPTIYALSTIIFVIVLVVLLIANIRPERKQAKA